MEFSEKQMEKLLLRVCLSLSASGTEAKHEVLSEMGAEKTAPYVKRALHL